MANIKSKQRSIKKMEKNRVRNSAIKSRVRTFIKKANAAIVANDKDANKFVIEANKELDKAVSKGVLHKGNANRRKSRLQTKLNKSLAKA
ncbi:MAG: 30S ribosomal protein S20 [Mycoplasma sp.]|nr:30S ribosomal protein S20 [Mycoplasma sp.]